VTARRGHRLPRHQANVLGASQENGLTIRIGIPQRSGSLAAHAFREGLPAMVSANAFWDAQRQSFRFPAATNLSELDFALDSAGFVAMRLWKRRGPQAGMAGVYPWSYGQYIELATQCGATWWAQPDLCCEPEIAEHPDEVDYRIRATATLLEGCLQVLYAWHNELAKTCSAQTVAHLLPPPVPVLQAWLPDDYRRSLDLMQEVWRRWEPWVASPRLIGLGSVCRRPLHHRSHGLLRVLAALEADLPAHSRLHLFGVKGPALNHVRHLPWVASVDSMAYDDASRRSAWAQGRPNDMAARTEAMSSWMGKAQRRALPAVGDQGRLVWV
jgi:hypothetical protein